ncbi:hypothetical protein B808_1159 [Fructilactobacillus florum 8D]|uniref:Uncharacterized protein n=1 Tax=Fructilactobacillus florum 8D TaxID=1221538 RepID=W9EG29_9LACO|nr:hypothetical protein B807_895 [Fructilactobacillus florum 2F]ETO39930.1 hypothetical protein B808_1159 [Fructilactobacillus florum 8D]
MPVQSSEKKKVKLDAAVYKLTPVAYVNNIAPKSSTPIIQKKLYQSARKIAGKLQKNKQVNDSPTLLTRI